MIENTAKSLFENFIGENADEFFALPQSGSSRINYIAEFEGKKYVITSNENVLENEAFIYFSDVFSSLNLNTPNILAVSENRKIYLQDFVGDETLSEIIAQNGTNSRVKNLVKQTLEKLFYLQKTTEGKIDYTKTFEYEAYDFLPIWNDLFYFKSMFVDILELPYHKSKLLLEFQKLVAFIENISPKTLMIRDFQARNIMVNSNDEVSFIDYQSAMKGPAMYDVVSFLFQAKADFSADFKNEMLDFYIKLWKDENLEDELKNSIKPIQLMRYLQVLGAYGFRGLIQKKTHFQNSIPKGIQNLVEFSENWNDMRKFPELKKLILELKTPETKRKIESLL